MAGVKGMKPKKTHEESPKFPEYWQKLNPDWEYKMCEEKAKWFKRSCNYQCIEYYEVKYPELSHEEHLKMKNDLQIQKRKNNPLYLQYYQDKYPELSLEEQQTLWHNYTKENNYQCEEYYIKRGANNDEAKKLRNERVKHAGLIISSKVSGQNNGMSSSNRTEQQRKESSPFSKEFYLSRGLTEEDWKNEIKKISKNRSYNTQLSYYLNKGYSYEEAYLKLKERQATFSLEKCIQKYGEELGNIKFLERQRKWLKSLYKNFQINGDGRSPQSKFAKDIINEICKYFDIKIPKKEYFIYDTENKRAYAYDFQLSSKIIEFNGDYWHCNPEYYDKTYYNKTKHMTAEQIWEYDKIKQQTAEKYNKKYLVIWESEYKNNREKTIKKCIEFIKS